MSEFIIIVDTAEQHAFRFQGIKADADQKYAPVKAVTVSQCLGRHPDSLGDYSLAGGLGKCHIERKSMEDCQSTLLGFTDGHRKRFEQELTNLAEIDSPLVLVECSLADLLLNAPSYGKKTAQQNAKILFRSVLAYQQDHRVPWVFCDGRGLAEQTAYWFLHRYWEKNIKPGRKRSVLEAV
jgi:hypothetical protein